MEQDEEVVFGEIFPNFKSGQHLKRNLWCKASQWRVPTRILGTF